MVYTFECKPSFFLLFLFCVSKGNSTNNVLVVIYVMCYTHFKNIFAAFGLLISPPFEYWKDNGLCDCQKNEVDTGLFMGRIHQGAEPCDDLCELVFKFQMICICFCFFLLRLSRFLFRNVCLMLSDCVCRDNGRAAWFRVPKCNEYFLKISFCSSHQYCDRMHLFSTSYVYIYTKVNVCFHFCSFNVLLLFYVRP